MLNSEPDLGNIGFGPAEALPKEMLYAKLLDCPVEFHEENFELNHPDFEKVGDLIDRVICLSQKVQEKSGKKLVNFKKKLTNEKKNLLVAKRSYFLTQDLFKDDKAALYIYFIKI